MNSEKILSIHLERQAIVYPRQSTLRQLNEHKESTKRQYELKTRASHLGWIDQKIVIIDEDLGLSGASGEWRQGFQRLAEGVAHGKVGGIFALEVSRLARSSADWHRLLELCALADVLIIDEQAIYNPRDYNDRLLLGLKGTMSEAELYWMRLRLEGGKLSKARRGELYFCPPAGYEWDRDICRFRFDPSEEVQRAVRLVFERFRLDGSAYAVARYFSKMSMMLPSRELTTKKLIWTKPRQTQIVLMLHNPIYTGTYAFGRKEERLGLVDGKIKKRKVTYLPQESWKCVIHDHHPAYISWEEYMANEKKLTENRVHQFFGENRGAAREGSALLQGLVLCGRCGHRMSVRYQSSTRRSQYMCRSNAPLEFGSICWDVSGTVIEKAVEEIFLNAVVPAEVNLALSVTNETEQQSEAINHQWKARIDRIEYETRLAERRYKAIDPDNRVVARTLEREWEEKLRELEKAKQEYEDICQKEKLELSEKDRKKIIEISKDLRSVWHSKTTTFAERKNLLRILIRDITLTPTDVPRRMTLIKIWWQSGTVTELEVLRVDKHEALAVPFNVEQKIKDLTTEGLDDNEIADELNNLKVPRRTGQFWDGRGIKRVRYTRGIYRPGHTKRSAKNQRADGLYSAIGVAEILGVNPGLVRNWASTGLLPIVDGGKTTRACWFRLDDEIIKTLKVAKDRRFRNLTDQKSSN